MSHLMGTFKKKSLWIMLYAVYLAMILLSIQAFIAQDSVTEIRANMDESYDYFLVFSHDGRTTHYTVTRHNPEEVGKITLTYWTEYNILEIHEVNNIKNLEIDVQSMFQDESIKIFKRSFDYIPGMDLQYWLKAGDGIFTVEFDIDSSEPMEQLIFTKFPEPNSVRVNNNEWWKTGLNYSVDENKISISSIPTGETTVILNFNSPNEIPIPIFSMTPEIKAGVDEEVIFDASDSFDIDGEIITWLWDFGDQIGKDSGVTVKYQYVEPGTYTIRLTVRDNAEPYAEAYLEKNVTIEYGAEENNDNDGLRDYWEWENFQSFQYDEQDDPDNDGYPNGLEYLAKTKPNDNTDFSEDSEPDGLDDKWEWQNFQSLTQGPQDDPDNDGATNLEEYNAGTDPINGRDKPKEPSEEESSEGMFGLGSNMDLIIILLIIVVIILVIVSIIISKRKKKKAAGQPKEGPEQQPIQVESQYQTPPSQIQQTSYGMGTGQSQPTIPTQPSTVQPEQSTQQREVQQQNLDQTAPSQQQYQSASVQSQQILQNTPTTQTQAQTQLQKSPLPLKGPPIKHEKPVNVTGQEPINLDNPEDQELSTMDQQFQESYPDVFEQNSISEPEQLPPDQSANVVMGVDETPPATVQEPPMEYPDEMVPEPVTEEMEELKSKMMFTKVKTPSPPAMDSKPTEPPIQYEATREEMINYYISNFNLDLTTASNIYDAGYIKVEYLKLAAIDELSNIDGVGFENANYIKGKANLLEPRRKSNNSNSSTTSAGSTTNNGGTANNYEQEEQTDQDSVEDRIPGEELLDED